LKSSQSQNKSEERQAENNDVSVCNGTGNRASTTSVEDTTSIVGCASGGSCNWTTSCCCSLAGCERTSAVVRIASRSSCRQGASIFVIGGTRCCGVWAISGVSCAGVSMST